MWVIGGNRYYNDLIWLIHSVTFFCAKASLASWVPVKLPRLRASVTTSILGNLLFITPLICARADVDDLSPTMIHTILYYIHGKSNCPHRWLLNFEKLQQLHCYSLGSNCWVFSSIVELWTGLLNFERDCWTLKGIVELWTALLNFEWDWTLKFSFRCCNLDFIQVHCWDFNVIVEITTRLLKFSFRCWTLDFIVEILMSLLKSWFNNEESSTICKVQQSTMRAIWLAV